MKYKDVHGMTADQRGFTIIELLIVIVVIAILASITIVSFVGVQDRAYDAAIKNDLSNIAKQIELIRIDTGTYPAAGATDLSLASEDYVGDPALQPSGLTINVSRGAYIERTGGGKRNLVYCASTNSDGEPIFALLAESKSENIFRYSSQSGIKLMDDDGGLFITSEYCGDGELSYPFTFAYAYFTNRGGWQSWAAQ